MYNAFGKRLLDIAVSFTALVLLLPIFLVLVIVARISSPGPAIFQQQRIGRDGQVFQFYKFRSMPVNTGDVASDRLGDIEIRPFGKFIRKTNLDELPQLYNVLRGDMSIVGPRPPIASQTELIEMRYNSGALACRPGLTGLAQVNSFDDMSVSEKAQFDAKYASSISFVCDMAIMFHTLRYLLKPPPTY